MILLATGSHSIKQETVFHTELVLLPFRQKSWAELCARYLTHNRKHLFYLKCLLKDANRSLLHKQQKIIKYQLLMRDTNWSILHILANSFCNLLQSSVRECQLHQNQRMCTLSTVQRINGWFISPAERLIQNTLLKSQLASIKKLRLYIWESNKKKFVFFFFFQKKQFSTNCYVWINVLNLLLQIPIL